MSKVVLITKPSLTTNTVIGSSQNPSTAGGSVAFYAEVAPATYSSTSPSGTVTFTVDGVAQTPATLINGLATLSTTLTSGNHSVTATYNRDSTYLGSTSRTLTQAVNSSFTTAWAPTGPGTANSSLIAKWYSDVTSATMWGAGVLVGDGVTDNSPLFRAMIASIVNTPTAKGGECFYFPVAGGGNYLFSTFGACTQDNTNISPTSIGNGGTGGTYAVGDNLTVLLGTSTTAAVMRVATVAAGKVTGVTMQTAGTYTVAPSNPATTSSDNAGGGTGTGCTLNVAWGCFDTSNLTGIHLIGDIGSDGHPASRIFSTTPNVFMGYMGKSTNTFHCSNLKFEMTGSNSWDIVFSNTLGQTFDKCDFAGTNGIWDISPGGSFVGSVRDCRFLGTSGVSQVGCHIGGATVINVHNCLFSGWVRGFSIQGTGTGMKDCTFDFNATGLDMGTTVTGSGGSVSRAHLENLTFTNNDTAIKMQNSDQATYHNVSITGSASTPNGAGSVFGIDVSNFGGSTLDRITTSGPFSTAAVNIAQGSNTQFYSCTINNSLYIPNVPAVDPHTGSPAKWRVASSMTGIPVGDRDNFVFGTITNMALQAGTLPQPTNICDIEARRVTVGPESLIVNVTTIGVIGNNANAAANVTALNTYLSAHAGQTIILYWPQGKYLFSGAIDMSGIPAWEFRGDGYDAAGGNGSRIAFTGTPGTNCIIADYGPTGCGQFHIRYMSIGTNQATGSTYVGIYMRNCAMSSIFNSQIQGNTCISMVNCFKCVMASVELAATLDGINMQNCYGCTLENPDVDGIPVGDAYHIGGGNKNALFSARAEVCDVALRIGTDADGNPSTTNNLSVCAASFEANNSGIIGANSINDYMSGIGIHCTTGSPAGHSRVAYVRQNTTDFTMLSCFNDGACSNVDGGFADGWAWYYASQTDRGLMVDCNGSNTSPNKNGTFDNLSSGTITQVACSFP